MGDVLVSALPSTSTFWLPQAFLGAHGYGGHGQSDPRVTYNVLQTYSLQLGTSAGIQGPRPSNSISSFAPTVCIRVDVRSVS